MEYLRVKMNKTSTPTGRVAVLINGKKNGFVGDILTLEEGFVNVSVDIKSAKPKTIELVDTTPTKPAEVTILC